MKRAKAVAKEMGRTVWLTADRRSKGGLLFAALGELSCKCNCSSKLRLRVKLNKPVTGYLDQCFTDLVG